jgi:hypothetical protein
MAQISHTFCQNHPVILQFVGGALVFAVGLYFGGRGSCDCAVQLSSLAAQVKKLRVDHASAAIDNAETLHIVSKALVSLASAVDLLSKALIGIAVHLHVDVPPASVSA